MRRGVVLSGFLGVVLRLDVMAMGEVSVMPGLLVVALIMMIGGVQMVLRGVLVMLRCFAMVISGFFRHGILLFFGKFWMLLLFRN